MNLIKEHLERFGEKFAKKIAKRFIDKTKKIVLYDDVLVEKINIKSKSYVSRYKGYGDSVIANTRQAFGIKECLIPAGVFVSRIAFEVKGYNVGEIVEGIQVIAVKNSNDTVYENVILNGKGVVKTHDNKYFNAGTKIIEVELQRSFNEAVYLLVACDQKTSAEGMTLYNNTTLNKITLTIPEGGAQIGTQVTPFLSNIVQDEESNNDEITPNRNTSENVRMNSLIVYDEDYKFDLNIEKNISNDNNEDRGNAELKNIFLGCRSVMVVADDYIKNVYIRLAEGQSIDSLNSLDVYVMEKKETKQQDVMIQQLYRKGDVFYTVTEANGRKLLKIPVDKSFDKDVFFVFRTPLTTTFRFNAKTTEAKDNYLSKAGSEFGSNGILASDRFEEDSRYTYTIHTHIESEESFVTNVFKRLDALEQNSNKNVDARR